MPSILNDEDKDTVKRFIPKQSNKIQAVAVARLYIAHPHKAKWVYTGLQGAIALVNDLVGNTYWLKMVDISPSSRGVIWDQEIFDCWSYNQDRTFFHTFELEECLAGLSFVNEKEAHTFKKKMDDREKNASKATRSTPFGGSTQPVQKHSLLGGLFHRGPSGQSFDASQTSLPPQAASPATLSHSNVNSGNPSSEFALLDAFDPLWREHFGQDLRDKGLTDDFIKSDQLFIVNFIREEQEKLAREQTSSPTSSSTGIRAPPPPPPAAAANGNASPGGSKRGSAPPPPPSRRSGKADASETSPPGESSPTPTPPPPPRPRFNAPPPLADAGKFAHEPEQRKVPPRPTQGNHGQAPPPPPRNSGARLSLENEKPNHKHQVPPPFSANRTAPPVSARESLPPATPARGLVPPPPPRRQPVNEHHTPASHIAPPSLPPKLPLSDTTAAPSASNRPVPPPPTLASDAPLPPPPPPLPPPNSSSGGPPPPPPPPLPPASGGSSGPALPKSDQQHKAMLGAIESAGGITALKKVDKSQIRDRSAAQVGDSGSGGGPSAGSATGGGGGGGMADALAAALQKRKEKVSRSDDESDNDDW